MGQQQVTLKSLLEQGAVLKFSKQRNKFFAVQRSSEVEVSQAEAKRMSVEKQVRPNGLDGNGNYVFALVAA